MSDLEKDPNNPVRENGASDDNSEKASFESVDPAFEPVDLDKEGIAPEAEVPSEPAANTPSASGAKASVIVPWVVAVIAVIALAVVLIRQNDDGGGNLKGAVGTLNGKDITKSEFYTVMYDQVGKDQAGSMLDNYMTLKLIDGEAEKAGLTKAAAEEAVAQEVVKIKAQFNFATDADFENALSSSGTTLETYKKNQILPQVELRAIFEKKLAPKEEDLKAYYDANKATFDTPEQVRASHILLATKAEAEAVLKDLKGGADFATVAKEKSTDTGSQANGGDLGFFGKGVMNEQFETAAFKLKKDEMSGVVESPNGFHIILVTDRKEAVTSTYDSVKDKVKAAYLDEKVNEGASEWIETAKKEAGYENLLTKKEEPAASPASSTAPAASGAASPSATSAASPSAGASK
ncbi:peptidylprolyl isomerase [Cohnella ginsengisoli]|uniref:peptidylprolyl isomerase n=1 Tax=Cohnella ginsengisoli TaxID=425004 RepID=A0A9X4KCZ2_9BACL|nr:peptidylprolyl isomerase [Cohnella ginsengisoli]MDG0789763.1 peptidylprolyl isomerase [Cohnella ginsengisoli]